MLAPPITLYKQSPMNKQYLYLLAGCCAAIILCLAPNIISNNYNHPQFWYALICLLLTGIVALIISVFIYAKRINPNTHLL